MAYTPHQEPRKALAAAAHVAALTGPIVPAAIWAATREGERFAPREAAKATNASLVLVLAMGLAAIVRMFVPLVGFVGTLALWVVPVAAVYFSISALRAALRGEPAQYPYRFKVVKTDD